MRLIDADKLMEFLDVGHLRPPTELCFSELSLKNILDLMPTIELTSWIPCSKHQPIKDDEYLVTWRGNLDAQDISHRRFTVTGLFILEHTEKDGWNTDDIKDLGYEDIEVLAWRPLPELYKEAENGE